jgi:hypothetical protein
MLHVDLREYEQCFRDNLNDWCMGGPRVGGYTRAGHALPFFEFNRLSWIGRDMVSVDDALWKNREETERWHIDFLTNTFPIMEKAYYWDYLKPRMIGIRRAQMFLDLFKNMKEEGYDSKFPIIVVKADFLEGLFRIDGCHRLACAKVLGMSHVPAIFLKAVTSQSTCELKSSH